MERRVGPVRLDYADLSGRGVEEVGRADDPPPERVEAPAVEGLARVHLILLDPEGGLLPDPRRLERPDRRPAYPAGQEAARRQRLVADHPRRQPEPGASG